MSIPANHPSVLKILAEGSFIEHGKAPPKPPLVPHKPEKMPSSQRSPKEAKATQKAFWALEMTLPIKTVSEMNNRDHNLRRHSRFKKQAEELAVWWICLPMPPVHKLQYYFPLTITFTRMSRNTLDDDNLRSSLKGIRDQIAKLAGADDGSDKFVWKYEQAKGKPGIMIRIEGDSQ